MQTQPAIRTFKLRRGRVTPGQAAALARAAVPSVTDVDVPTGAVLEIGFGFGEATAELAERFPDVPIVAVDVHTPGIGRLLQEIDRRSLTNLSVVEGDARELLSRLENNSLLGVRVFFPDPWPKVRHHKRRLVSPTFLDVVARVVQQSGFLHVATDIDDYAEWVKANITAHSAWTAGSHAMAIDRPMTRFEQRAHTAGRTITDIVALRSE